MNINSRALTQKSGYLRRRGAAAVEFAVVTPLFLLLLAGIIEFGQAFRIQHSLSNASRRGARSAIVDGATASGVIQKIQSQCNATLGVARDEVDVDIAVNGVAGGDLSAADQGDEIQVTVRVRYSAAAAGFYANTFSNAILSSTCTLEHE